MRSLKTVMAEEWKDMDNAQKRGLLLAGGCLINQAVVHENETMPSWGSSFEFGSSPVTQFALEGDNQALREALDLGACPFTVDLEGDGPFEYAFRRLSIPGGISEDKKAKAFELLAMCWQAGIPLLEPKDDAHPALGHGWAKEMKFIIARVCFLAGQYNACKDLGMDFKPEWLLDTDPERIPMLRARMVQAGFADHFRILVGMGMSATDPVKYDPLEPSESLWLWLGDDNHDIEGMALALLEAGNDPRTPLPDGSVPFDRMRDDKDNPRVVARVEGLLHARDERRELGEQTPEARKREPRGRSRPRGL